MPSSVLILTAILPECRALSRAGLNAVPIGIGASRLKTIHIPPGTRRIILAGVAGGLDPALSIGDVIVDGPADLIPPGLKRGHIHTVAHLVSTVAEKAALFTATGAAVVEMEQSVVARWAGSHGLPLIGIRAVSDSAAHSVHPSVLRFVNDIGRVKPIRVAIGIARRPNLIRQLLRLNRGTHTALITLAAATAKVTDVLERPH